MSAGPILTAHRCGWRLLAAASLVAAAAAAGAGDLAGPELVTVRAGSTGLPVLANPANAVDQQQGGENRAAIVQNGIGHVVTLEQIGSANTATIRQDGSGRMALIGQYGDGNRADIVQGPQAPAVTVLQYGNQGYARVVQY